MYAVYQMKQPRPGGRGFASPAEKTQADGARFGAEMVVAALTESAVVAPFAFFANSRLRWGSQLSQSGPLRVELCKGEMLPVDPVWNRGVELRLSLGSACHPEASADGFSGVLLFVRVAAAEVCFRFFRDVNLRHPTMYVFDAVVWRRSGHFHITLSVGELCLATRCIIQYFVLKIKVRTEARSRDTYVQNNTIML